MLPSRWKIIHKTAWALRLPHPGPFFSRITELCTGLVVQDSPPPRGICAGGLAHRTMSGDTTETSAPVMMIEMPGASFDIMRIHGRPPLVKQTASTEIPFWDGCGLGGRTALGCFPVLLAPGFGPSPEPAAVWALLASVCQGSHTHAKYHCTWAASVFGSLTSVLILEGLW